MEKIDYRKKWATLYSAKAGVPVIVDVPAFRFLMIDGQGDPNTSEDYKSAIAMLYSMAYTIKFMCKQDLGVNYPVMPLEGLWWTENMRDFSMDDKRYWSWTAMIMQPDIVNDQIYARALEQVEEKKHPVAISKLRFDTYDEGRAAQVLFIGPYESEGPTIEGLHAFIELSGGILDERNKHHHEIYLSDPRRTAAAKLKTIIRQPF